MTERMPKLPHQVVRASAGAGKTYQLTTRYLDLLIRQEPLHNILATTFTRKAAGEILDRVLGRLASACADHTPRQQLAYALNQPDLSRAACLSMLRSLTGGLNRLAVGTIDGFFNRAARAMEIDLGLPSDPRLIDEGSPLAQQMRFDAIQSVLGEQVDTDEGLVTLIEMLRRLHHDTAQRSVTEAIDSIVKDLGEVFRNYPDRSLWDQLPDTGTLSRDLRFAAIEVLEAKQDDLPRNKDGKVYATFKDRVKELIASARLELWDEVLANGLVAKVNDGEAKYGHAPISEEWAQAIRPVAVHAKAVRLSKLADQTLATYDLLALFDRHYKDTRFGQRVLLFSDLTHALAEGLPGLGQAGVEELCYRLDARVTHLLLDEFQDTSLKQWDVLAPFAQQITDNFEDSRSLFCVGDAKQAIYGWRGGCAELFDEVESLPGIEPTTLSNSYRSSQVVLDAVNAVFTGLGGNPALETCRRAAAQWQQGFETHRAVKQGLPGHVVLQSTTHDSDTANDANEDDADVLPDAHAHYVAGYIQDLMDQLPGQTIGVLMRSRAKAWALMHALRSLEVPVAEEGGNPISHDPAVSAVLAAIQFADHPGDSVARFHLANSPMGEVLGMNVEVRPEDLARDLRRVLIDRGYADVIAGWVESLSPSCDAVSLRRLTQLIELAEGYDRDGATLRPGFFVQSVQATKVEDASPAPIRVMTIHASKGLEFDLVVLPDLDGVLSAQDARDLVVLDRDSPIEPVRGVYRRVKGTLSEFTPALAHAHAQRAYEKRIEDLCLLYVAMTRARQGLHLLVRPLTQRMVKGQASGKPAKKGLTNLSYAAILRQALCTGGDEGFDGDEQLYAAGVPDWAGNEGPVPEPDIPSVVAPLELLHHPESQTRSWVNVSPSQMHNQAKVQASDLLNIHTTGGQRYGTIVHAMLEQVGFADEALPRVEELQQATAAVDSEGIDIPQTAKSILNALQSIEVQKLLNRAGADTLWRERRFMVRIDDRLITGSFDRVQIWYEESRPLRAVLIDYKTDRVDDQSMDKAVRHYTDQLRLYRKALSAMLKLDEGAIETKLCFIGDHRVASVD